VDVEHLGLSEECSQWHIKRYVTVTPTATPADGGEGEDTVTVTLPAHTDPSLLSITISSSGGLEYLDRNHQKWNHVHSSFSNSEWKMTVVVGSIMSKVSKVYPVCRHRVSTSSNSDVRGGTNTNASERRMALTYFLRPCPTAVLEGGMTFETWCARTMRRYAKSKTKKPKASKNNEAPKIELDKSIIQNELNKAKDENVDDVPRCSLLYPSDDTPLVGKEQYLGGECSNQPPHFIYAIPGHATRVLLIDPSNNKLSFIGPEFAGEYKWLRSVQTPGGIIYGLPCHANCVLKIDTVKGEVTTIGEKCLGTVEEREEYLELMKEEWKYHGGAISPKDGHIYCIPQRATRVLKIDTRTEECSLIGPVLPGRNKFYGGIVSPLDGALYGIPQNASNIIRIDPTVSPYVTLHGDFPPNQHLWHGGQLHKGTGAIFGIPANANTVLRIDPLTLNTTTEACIEPRITQIGNVKTGNHRSDGKYKFLGSVTGFDDMIYLIPSDADYVYQINPYLNTVKPVGGKHPLYETYEPIRHNKWQNGFVSFIDKSLYAIPLKAETVLRIQTQDFAPSVKSCSTKPKNNGKLSNNIDTQTNEFSSEEYPIVSTVGGPFKGLNKWEGGVMSKDGVMFCMPLNSKAVLRIEPPKITKKWS